MNDVNCSEEAEVAPGGDCVCSDGNSNNPYESESLQYSPDFVHLQLQKDLVVINGKINSMDRNSLITNLKRLNLNINGSITALKKRLKEHYKSKKLSSNNLRYIAKTYPYYVVIDFEATCNEVNPPNYQHEIIEFPAVLVDSQKKVIVDEFHCYCKPRLNPQLSKFCTELTGISQATVNEADEFPIVLQKFEAWMGKHKLGSKHKYAFVTDGPWDMCRFFSLQCKMSQIQYPRYAKKWINLRKTFSVFYRTRKMRLPVMLELLGSKFEGRQHSGLHDARNIAALLLLMMKDGVSIEINDHIRPMKKYHNYRKNFNATATENNDVEKQDQEKRIDEKGEMLENL